MLSVYVVAYSYFFSYFRGLEPRGRLRGRSAEEKKRKMGKTKTKDDRGMDAQVLLLIDPGAELGWAELSDTLPSVGGRKGTHCHQNKTHLTQRIHFCWQIAVLIRDYNAFKINIYVLDNIQKSLKSSQEVIFSVQFKLKLCQSSDWGYIGQKCIMQWKRYFVSNTTFCQLIIGIINGWSKCRNYFVNSLVLDKQSNKNWH